MGYPPSKAKGCSAEETSRAAHPSCLDLPGTRRIEAAVVLGGGGTAVPLRVRLPPIMPALIAGWAPPSPAIPVIPPDRSCGLDRSPVGHSSCSRDRSPVGHTREGKR